MNRCYLAVGILSLGLASNSSPLSHHPLDMQAAQIPRPLANFNGDWYADLAVGVPFEGIDGIPDAGDVNVLYGRSAAGLSAAGNQLWYQGHDGLIDAVAEDDAFGRALAVGDFDGDGYYDLAVGVYGQEVGGFIFAGAVHILYGYDAATGLGAASNEMWSQDSPDVPGNAEAGDQFGNALAAGDFDGDGRDDLAVGVHQEEVDGVQWAGAVNVLYGTASGLTGSGSQLWHQNVADIMDAPEEFDQLGRTLAAGDFDGDGYSDLAIGVPNESMSVHEDAGAVHILYGSAAGLTAAGSQEWYQDSPDIDGVAETDDRFGSALASGDFDGDGRDDLAVGVPYEDVALPDDGAGAVNVLYGSGSGLTASGNQLWHQDVIDVQDAAEQGDRFGHAVAAGDFNGDGRDDLAVGVRDESVDGIVQAGAVNVLYGSDGGLSVTGDQFWSQNDSGILGAAEAGDQFGSALAVGDFNGDGRADLAVGVPAEDVAAADDDAGAVNVLYGSADGLTASGNQLWHQDSAGILGGADPTDYFGTALAAIPRPTHRVCLPLVLRQ